MLIVTQMQNVENGFRHNVEVDVDVDANANVTCEWSFKRLNVLSSRVEVNLPASRATQCVSVAFSSAWSDVIVIPGDFNAP